MTDLHNIEAEQALLGAVLYDNDLLDEMGWLKPAHFFDPVHERIYQSVAELIEQGVTADAVRLKTHLETDDGLQEMGGVNYLAVLLDSAANSRSAVEYGRMVHDLAIKRGAVVAAGEVSRLASDSPDMSGPDILNAADRIFGDLSDEIGGESDLAEPVEGFAEVWEAARIARETGVIAGIKTGLKSLDNLLGSMMGGDLIVLGGRPSMGKTAVVLDIARRVAEAGNKVGFCSIEMTKSQLWQRLMVGAAARNGFMVKLDEFKTGRFYSDDDQRGAYEATRELAALLRGNLLVADKSTVTASEIGRQSRQMRRAMGGLDLLVIDYLGLIQSDGKRRDGNKVQEISDITGYLKRLAKEMGVPILLLCQLSRNLESRDDKRPRLSDLRDSGSIEQDADVVMFVYREAYYLEREEPREKTPEHAAWLEELQNIRTDLDIILAKQRQGELGTAKLTFRGESMRVDDRGRG